MRRVTSWISLAAMSLGLMVSAVLLSTGTASAANTTCGGYGQPTCPETAVITQNTTPAAVPDGDGTSPPAVASTSTGALAFTGADVAGTVVVGVALIGAGVLVVGTSRRRRTV